VRWTAADEGRHDDAPGPEGWGFEFGDGAVTGRVQLTLDAGRGAGAFVADLVVARRGRVVVADETVPLPRRAAGLEIRADGLWASLHCETAFEHWTLGLEAFGLRVDEADRERAGTWAELRGERIPVGCDLEWELRGPPEPLVEGAGYAQPGWVSGEVLVVRDRVPVDGPAVREHWWGGAPGVRSDPAAPLAP
jgi:hypothetical protein